MSFHLRTTVAPPVQLSFFPDFLFCRQIRDGFMVLFPADPTTFGSAVSRVLFWFGYAVLVVAPSLVSRRVWRFGARTSAVLFLVIRLHLYRLFLGSVEGLGDNRHGLCGCWISQTQKGMVLWTWKGGLVTNVFGPIPWSGFNASETGWVGGSMFDSLIFQVCWDLQVSMCQVCLHSGTDFISVSVHGVVFGWLRSKEHLRLLLCSGGC